MVAKNEETWEGELEDLLNAESGLYGEEIRFIEQMEYKRNKFINPSDPQKEWLGRIWDRICG